MTTDILIPLGKGSRHQDFELRMCLRSIEKHLKGVGNIFIVGEKPEWVKNVVHIPFKDNPNNWNRARNIYDKIMAGIDYEHTYEEQFCEIDVVVRLSDNFLFMNDDHYLLQDYEANEFPYYYRRMFDLQDLLKKGNNPQMKQTINTFHLGSKYSENDFDIHCPIVFNKRIFREIFAGLPEKWPEHGFLIKSYYANTVTFEPYELVLCEDLKFSEPLMKESIYMALEGRAWFSIGDRCLKSGSMKEVLQELYSTKSKYEND
jgi:hypothetical protein